MSDDAIRIEQRGAVRWLTLNRPRRRNALNGGIIDALNQQVDAVAADDDTAVVVVRGDGESFCAGGDFTQFLESDDPRGPIDFLTDLSACFSRIEGSSKPWVAALHGHAIAGGLELALVCDVVVAAEGTLIGDGHLVNRLIPGGGSSVRLERAVGKGWARWMHLTGDLVAAEQLIPTGWVRGVVARDDLDTHVESLALRLAAARSPAQNNLKTLLNDVFEMDADEALSRELEAFGDNWIDSDARSALQRFLRARGGATPDSSETHEREALHG